MTTKQKIVAQKIVENHGNVSKSMLEAGYSPASAKNPKNLTNSKGWQQLMEKYLPDATLLQVHREGLQANKVVSARITGADANEATDDFIEIPDHPTRHKFLETAYKLKKRIGPDNQTLQQFTGDITVTWANGEEVK